MRRTCRGTTLIELVISIVMTLAVAGALFSIYTSTFSTRDMVVGQSGAEALTRTPIDLVADHIRNAQQYYNGGNQQSISSYSVISAGSATSVTYYRSNSSSDTVRYFLDGTDLKRTAGGSTSVVMRNVNSLEFSYFKAPTAAGNYNNASVVSTTDPHQPTAAERPFLSQIRIRASVSSDGFSRELVTTVRLRNSPRKVRI